jgi:hypothetical protein
MLLYTLCKNINNYVFLNNILYAILDENNNNVIKVQK